MTNILQWLQEQQIHLTEQQQEELSAFQREVDALFAQQYQSQLITAVEAELSLWGVTKQKLLWALLDQSKLTLQEGEVLGLKEQLTSLKADPETAFLFEARSTEKPRFVPLGRSGNVQTARDAAVRGVMGL